MEENYFIKELLELFGVKKVATCNEDRFDPKSISEKNRTKHFIVQVAEPLAHEVQLRMQGYAEKHIKHLEGMKCFKKQFETTNVCIWMHSQKNNQEDFINFVEHYIYQKYSQTVI